MIDILLTYHVSIWRYGGSIKPEERQYHWSGAVHCLSEKTRERVSCASEKGLVKLKESAQERQKHRDVTNRAAIDRVSGTNTAPLVWHKSCYSTFTSPTHISRVYKKNEAVLSAASRTTTAPDTTPLAIHEKFHVSNELGSLHVLPECQWYV